MTGPCSYRPYPVPVRPNEGFELRLGLFAFATGDDARFFYDDFSCDVVFD